MKIAVTGATGMLGSHLVPALRQAGHQVVALGRNPIIGARLSDAGATFVACDILDYAALAAAVEGCDGIVHGAALSSPWGDAAQFMRVNADGTANVLAAVAQAAIPRLIHISSTSVMFAYRDQLGIREDQPLPPPVNAYAASKQRAEQLVHQRADAIILRPRAIFGPGDTSLLPRLIRAAQRGPLPLIRGGQALVDLTPVQSLCDVIIKCLARPHRQQGLTLNVSNGEPIQVRDLIETVLGGIGCRVRWRAMPAGLVLHGASLLEAIHALWPGRPEPIATRYTIGLIAYSQTLDISRLKSTLDWQPPITLAAALAATISAEAPS